MHIDTFEVLGDGTRRQLLARLRGGERSVNDLVSGLGVHQSGVSRHLRILRDAGFVSVRPAGQQRIYALKPEPFRELEDWLAGYREVWEARLDRLGAALGAERAGSVRPRGLRSRKR